MTREEERIKETIRAADEYIHKRIYEDDCGRTGDTFPAFIEGAEWADQHPRKGLVDIEKACNFLKQFLSTSDKNDYGETHVKSMWFNNEDDFIEDFRRAMLEEE